MEDYTSAEKLNKSGNSSRCRVNVQSDWTQATNTADDYIKNKPAIPTKVSDLTNDTGYINRDILKQIQSLQHGINQQVYQLRNHK